MKSILIAACILGMAVCAPHHVLRDEMFMEFDIRYAPAEAGQVIPAGAPRRSLEVLLPVNAQRQPIGGPIHGFIKQEISDSDDRGTRNVFYPFGFAVVDSAAPVAPVAPAAPIVPVIAARVPVARRRNDDDDGEDD